ncbi:hypothetical protein [Tomitella gaofuii]|uniref:hypothetical protein n=1 Tax=Tomitella gaofuii TaxID=2760083 RepID=UPI0015FD05AF
MNEGTLVNWRSRARAERDGSRSGLSEDERAELVRLRKENVGRGPRGRTFCRWGTRPSCGGWRASIGAARRFRPPARP